ncbi:MAG: 16S rRNA (cytidine(1402)-2'-O)-methyltransferase [Rhodospirillaceae bacterium]|nr:16S rRNA (cytidine(1402)-2'-O)-methyltransferase [Rhodospirillaceae bacterium]
MTKRTSGSDGAKKAPLPGGSNKDIDNAAKPNAGGRASKQPEAGLYLVATPIGNARDITLRALDVLGLCHVIACEDTRVTAKLLALHGIHRPLLSYHEHNAERMRPKIIERLKQGEIVALVSDAGTPLISDPGYRLVRAVTEAGLFVTHLPGASSVLTGLVLSGLPSDRFLFAGFPPPKSGKRLSLFEQLKTVPASLVFLESTRRLAKSLADMAAVFGPRQAATGRELTKMFEEMRRGPLDELAAHYSDSGAPKGEVVVVVAPPSDDESALSDAAVDALLTDTLKTLSVRGAASQVAELTGRTKRDLYNRALVISGKKK